MKGLFDTASASLSAITEERSAMESYIKFNSRSVGGQVVVLMGSKFYISKYTQFIVILSCHLQQR